MRIAWPLAFDLVNVVIIPSIASQAIQVAHEFEYNYHQPASKCRLIKVKTGEQNVVQLHYGFGDSYCLQMNSELWDVEGLCRENIITVFMETTSS
ncbi:hypothetical protein BC936DRAFT_143396 [Jimgerdemannia flammicorona]|uniref:Uncharacterized protein n=1 Tax=Jimgerdemannia flammicorona TaxID=994334 RepID=A0A432ZZ98_9FUNG|nr:hypothetical protein BC936DRAFT_143396 [Jimgerdemannia flammicorona]